MKRYEIRNGDDLTVLLATTDAEAVEVSHDLSSGYVSLSADAIVYGAGFDPMDDRPLTLVTFDEDDEVGREPVPTKGERNPSTIVMPEPEDG